MSELAQILGMIIDRYLDIQRDGRTALDAISDVLYGMGYVVLTTEYHKKLEQRGK